MINEFPASAKPASTVVTHWSKKLRGYGLRVSLMPGGDFGVYNIAPIGGRPTAHLFARTATEAEAREIANREWVGQGF